MRTRYGGNPDLAILIGEMSLPPTSLADTVLRDPLVLSIVGASSQLTLAIALTIALAVARRALGFRGTPWWVGAQLAMAIALAAVVARNAIGPDAVPGEANTALRILGAIYGAGKLLFFAGLTFGTAELLGASASQRLQFGTVAVIVTGGLATAYLTPDLGRIYLGQGLAGFVAMASSAWRLHRAPPALRTRGTRWLSVALGFYALVSLPYVLGLRYQGTPVPGDTLGAVRFVFDRLSLVDILGQLLLGLAMLALLLEQQREVARRARANTTAMQREGATTMRLEALGRVAATVAHELNNPLTVVVGTAEQLAASPVDPRLRDDLQLIVREALRCRHVARDLLLATREEAPPHVEVATATIVRHAADAVRLQASAAGVQLHVVTRSGVHVLGDQVALEQAVINLLRNAIDATPPGRSVSVRGVADGDAVLIVVEDEGTGIAPAVRETLFEPLRTTKPAGRGTGLGLSIVRGIAARHGGTIEVESQPERALGSCFRLRLPRVADTTVITGETLVAGPRDERAAAATDEASSVPLVTTLESPVSTPVTPVTPVAATPGVPAPLALIIDDEPGIRGVLGRTLERYGYRVREANDGLEGQLALADAAHAPIDVIFCDVRMPRLDGVQLLGWMGDACPELLPRTVLLTGDTVSDEVRATVARTGCQVLAKPFARRDLEQALARVRTHAA